LRQYDYNLDHAYINGFFEKKSVDYLQWSRFRAFYDMQPQCKTNFTVSCWDAFVAQSNTTIVIVDRMMSPGLREQKIPVDEDAYAYALALQRRQAPVLSTAWSEVYIVGS
jgi:hypothetical protein